MILTLTAAVVVCIQSFKVGATVDFSGLWLTFASPVVTILGDLTISGGILLPPMPLSQGGLSSLCFLFVPGARACSRTGGLAVSAGVTVQQNASLTIANTTAAHGEPSSSAHCARLTDRPTQQSATTELGSRTGPSPSRTRRLWIQAVELPSLMRLSIGARDAHPPHLCWIRISHPQQRPLGPVLVVERHFTGCDRYVGHR